MYNLHGKEENMDELILKERETKENLIKLVNECGLPAFILKSMLKDLYEQLNNLEEQQYNQAIRKKEGGKENDKD
jgi:hypothetical protein